MEEKIQNIKNQALAQISETENLKDLENVRLLYLGRKGVLNKLVRDIAKLPSSKRKKLGILFNEAKSIIFQEIKEKEIALKGEERKLVDLTLPGIKPHIGKIHPVSLAIEEISKIFERLGFVRVRYQEVEWDWYAFESLNMPRDHPARDEWETFFIDTKAHKKFGEMVLTPHTSSGQVREMERSKGQAVKMINISKCYRRQSDISHIPMFHQFEGLVVDKDISITHLKGTLDFFAKEYFGEDREIRLRPYHFQFTEPSFEVDISCDLCQKKGCKLCKEGWLELGGAGMVHPVVLKNGGYDPNRFSGFAFGWGVERVLMMKSGIKIPDIRILYSDELEILEKF